MNRLTNTRAKFIAVVTCGVLFAAGCGSGSSSSTKAAAPATTAQQPAAQPTTAQTATTPASSKPVVTISNYAYAPSQLTVKVGQRVTFINRDSANHTATSDKAGAFDTGNLDSGHSATVSFSKPGIYTYHCQFHPFMHGRIVVR